MVGGWIGYVYSFAGCGLVLALLGASTAVLYAVARVRPSRRPRLRVESVSTPKGH